MTDRKDDDPRTMIRVRDLHAHFPTREGVVKAIEGASYHIDFGQTVGIVGESGCGKSVTARSILRILESPGRIVGGEILYRRRPGDEAIDLVQMAPDSREMRAIRGAEISLVFQEPMTSFSPVHTIGHQMVQMIRTHRPMSRAEARAHAIGMLERVGISRAKSRIDEYAYQLSGGLRQRAMIAMALSCGPGLLIADEPTTALDVTTQAQILDLILQLQANTGMAVMLITHDLGVVAETCDHVVVMYLGKVVEEGPVDDIFHNPKHPYTQALLRSMPSMTMPTRVMLPSIAGSIPHPYNRPKGCAFHTRCPSRMPVCTQREPRTVEVAPAQRAACFLYEGA